MRRLSLTLSLAAGLVLGTGIAPALAATDVNYDPSPFGSGLFITGEPDVDLIGVSVSDNTITITDVGPGGITTVDPDCAAVNPAIVTCPLDPPGADIPVDFVGAQLDAGSDTYTNENLLANNDIDPDDGDDVVSSGPDDDFIDDSPGDDTQEGGEGDDDLDGTSGDDINGNDVLNGGPGVDFVDYSGYGEGVNATLDDQPNDGRPGESDNLIQVEGIGGTDFDDSLTGNNVANQLDGDDGDDRIAAQAGNDELFGDDGDDVINPGASPDGSRDFVFCGSGFDVALAEPVDAIDPSCERRGARIVGESAKVKRKNQAKVLVACPLDARDPCAGSLILLTGGKQISKAGAFDVSAGASGNAKVKLTGKGKKALKKGGGKLLVTAQAQTVETGGVAVTEAQVLLTGKAKKKKPR
jgi:Ca2+-binding RTX toxin-like protein